METTAVRLALAIAFALPLAASAQREGSAAVGDRVRIRAPESGYETVVGRVVSTDAHRIHVKVEGANGLFYMRRDLIEHIDVSVQRRRHVLGGMAIGGLNGIFFGVGLSGMKTNEDSPGLSKRTRSPAMTGAIVGALVGTTLGGVGGFFLRTDDWRAISNNEIATGLSPHPVPRRTGLGLSIPF